MEYVEAIQEREIKPHEISLFLAGGITNCPDWQEVLVQLLRKAPLVIFNPRRKDFPIHDPNASLAQIKWEHEHMRKVSLISFWFSRGSLNPIVLFELGRWSHQTLKKKIFVGVDPEYKRRLDVEIQLKLEKPEVEIVYSLTDLTTQILNFLEEK